MGGSEEDSFETPLFVAGVVLNAIFFPGPASHEETHDFFSDKSRTIYRVSTFLSLMVPTVYV